MGRGVFETYRVCRLVSLALLLAAGQHGFAQEKHFLYVAVPGIRNYVEYGGIGILVFDIDNGYRFVKRIPTWVLPKKQPENVKGIAASAQTGKLYVSTMNRLAAFDVHSEKKVWDRPYEGGCDRMAISRDGQTLYVPSFEGPFWNVVNAATGDIITRIQTNSGAHNTVASPDGTRVYLAGLHSPLLSVADTTSQKVVQTVGPFANSIRPFTINGKRTLCFVNVNELLGFEVGDLQTGKVLHRVEVQGFQKGPVKHQRVSKSRHRLDAGRKRIMVGRWRQQPASHFRRHRNAAKASRQYSATRHARLGFFQYRWTIRLLFNRRGDRHTHPTDRRHLAG